MIFNTISVVIFGSTVLLAVLAVRRASRWFAGRWVSVDLLGGIISLPRRYLVDVHDVMARSRYAAVMHTAAAGGFVGAALLILALFGFQFRVPWLAWPTLLFLAIMATGTFLVAYRRWAKRPPHLSASGFGRLPLGLLAFAAGFLVVTPEPAGLYQLSEADAWIQAIVIFLIIWGCMELIVGMSFGPMKHALAGVLHLVAHPRPGRFDQDRVDSDLHLLDLEESKLGVEVATDFAWNRLLEFDACVQCGRCETVCPAFAAGQPLNPKRLIQDLVVAMGDSPAVPLVAADSRVAPETVWACTTCRACVHECPMTIEHVDAVVDLRRFLALEKGAVPDQGARALEELRKTDNAAGVAPERRADWAGNLDLPILAMGGRSDILLWLGEGAFDTRNQRTLHALVQLLRIAKVDFAILGNEECDCGDLARRLGDEATFQDLATRNIATLGKYQFNRILTTDPHVLHCLNSEYPVLGGYFDVVHHTTFLAGLVEQGALRIARRSNEKTRVTYHDPCYLGRYNGELEAPRKLIDALGADFVEMERSGMRSSCCGGGGGAALSDVPGKRRVPDVRMDHVRETDAGVVAVACPNCAIMLEGVVQPRPQVVDVAELLLAAMGDCR